MINTVFIFVFQNERSMLPKFCMFWLVLHWPRPGMLVYIYTYIYLSIYVYISICTVHIFTMHAGSPLSFQCHQWESMPDKNVLLLLLLLSSLSALSAPSSPPNNLSLSLCSTPANRPLFSPSLRHSSSPPPLSPLSTSSCPPPPIPTSLCLHQTAQCEDGAEETQWSGQHLGGPGEGKSPFWCG